MEKPAKRPRGRPRIHPRPEDIQPPVEAGGVTDDQFFAEHYAKPVTGKRMNILQVDEATLQALFRLGRLFCTQAEAAGFLGVAPRTLQSFLHNNEEAMNAWQDGLQNARVSLRRKQFSLADKLAPMAIFLGKNYLGQKDEHHTNVNVNKPAKEMSESELEEIAARGLAMKPQQKPEPNQKLH